MEQLVALRQQGAIDNVEFQAAKRALLYGLAGGDGPPSPPVQAVSDEHGPAEAHEAKPAVQGAGPQVRLDDPGDGHRAENAQPPPTDVADLVGEVQPPPAVTDAPVADLATGAANGQASDEAVGAPHRPWSARRLAMLGIVVAGVIGLAVVNGRGGQETMTSAALVDHLRSNVDAADGSGTLVDTLDCADGIVRDGDDVECWVSINDGRTIRLVVTPKWDGTGWDVLVDAPGGTPYSDAGVNTARSTTDAQASVPDESVSDDAVVDAEPATVEEDGTCMSEGDPDCAPGPTEDCGPGETLVETGACEPAERGESAWDTLGPDFEGWDGSLLPDGTCPENFHVIGVSAPYCEADF